MNDIPVTKDEKDTDALACVFQVGSVTTSMDAVQLKAASILASPEADPAGAVILIDRLGLKHLYFNVKG